MLTDPQDVRSLIAIRALGACFCPLPLDLDLVKSQVHRALGIDTGCDRANCHSNCIMPYREAAGLGSPSAHQLAASAVCGIPGFAPDATDEPECADALAVNPLGGLDLEETEQWNHLEPESDETVTTDAFHTPEPGLPLPLLDRLLATSGDDLVTTWRDGSDEALEAIQERPGSASPLLLNLAEANAAMQSGLGATQEIRRAREA